ncbi:MAG: methionine adenosyltransferase [Spirochaetes bacterium RBG_16_67_19]|nr:MAG: methionine adenosyltransferase [Spirochaetes bacterium RBG_16_67_19]
MSERQDYLFTSESVGEGHPDKICDQISDAVLDSALKQDPNARVACESFTTTGLVLVGGEITTDGYIDLQRVVRGVLKSIGYDDPDYGIDYQSCAVLSCIHGQSQDIAQGVGRDLKNMGAGDQGMMYGFACRETPELMPAPIHYAHAIMRRASLVRKRGILPFMRPDGKCQVTVVYENGKPKRVSTVVLSHQHSEDIQQEELREAFIEEIIRKAIPAEMLAGQVTYHINPTGRFVIGGPHGDTGLTGRKIIVDTYGGMARHGGGAFSGKDPSKVDRSAAYLARWIAKNIVAAELAERCEVQLAYAIGVREPVQVVVSTFGTGKVPDARLEKAVTQVFDCTPGGIITALDLLKPVYQETATYGHFGREEFAWEKVNRVEALRERLK